MLVQTGRQLIPTPRALQLAPGRRVKVRWVAEKPFHRQGSAKGYAIRRFFYGGFDGGYGLKNQILSNNINEAWRRDRDSNPGSARTDNGFRDRRIRPLCHLSASGVNGG